MSEEWTELAGWWMEEVRDDPAYQEEVLPLLTGLLEPGLRRRYLDLGCGEGQSMRAVRASGGSVIGCDVNPVLLERASRHGPVVRARLPELGWIRPGALDGAFCVLVLEHLEELDRLFRQVARVVRPGGRLVAVLNHPVFTAPDSGPVIDPDDGEVLWRWGRYLDRGRSRELAGEGWVTFHHRPLGALLERAAGAGWCLERIEERGVGAAAVARDALLGAQTDIPRLLGIRWRSL